MKNHPLFPEHADADILGIHVTRFEQGGSVWAAPKFPPEALASLEDLHARYGGGRYEIIGHGPIAGKKGEEGKPRQGICARQAYVLDGPSKPLNPPPPGEEKPAPVFAAPAPNTELVAILQMMAQQNAAQMQLMGTMITAALNRPREDTGTAAAIQALGEITKASLMREAAPAAAPNPWAADPLKMFADVSELLAGIQAGTREAQAKVAAGNAGDVDLDGLANAASKALDIFEKGRKLAREGKSPAEAAGELQDAAVAAE